MEFVDFDLAKKLKEKGFKEECLCHYIGDNLVYNIESPIANNQLWFSHNKFDNIWHRDNYDAPTISQVLKWLREVKRIDSGAVWDNRDNRDGKWVGYINEMDMPDLVGEYVLPNTYDAYEQAALKGIEYVLNNLI